MNEMINGSMGFAQKPAQMDVEARREDQSHRGRSGAPQVLARVHEPHRQDRGLPHAAAGEHLEQILEIELGMVQQRILQATGNNQFVFSCTPPAKQFLLQEGTDLKYGARHLKRAIERNIVFPLANLVATGQVKLGDFIRIDIDGRQDDLREGSRRSPGSGPAGALRSDQPMRRLRLRQGRRARDLDSERGERKLAQRRTGEQK